MNLNQLSGVTTNEVETKTLMTDYYKNNTTSANSKIPKHKLTIGCDPEFYLVENSKGTLVPAQKYLNRWDALGYDGMLAELRPDPSTDPKEVTNNIRKLLKVAINKVENEKTMKVTLKSASMYRGISAGFHIHFGLPPQLLQYNMSTANIMAQIVHILDYYIALPCACQENNIDLGRRCTFLLPYGKPGDYRISQRTLEYRVPGGVMLKHPLLTNGLLTLATTIMNDILDKIEKLTNGFQYLSTDINLLKLYPNVPKAIDIYNLICAPKFNFKVHLDIILKSLSLMKTYDQSLERFFECIAIPFNPYLKANWDL